MNGVEIASVIWVCATNLASLPAVIWCCRHREWIGASTMFTTMIVSIIYHAIYAVNPSIDREGYIQFFDFLLSLSMISEVGSFMLMHLVALKDRNMRLVPWYFMFILTGFLVAFYRFDLWVPLFLVGSWLVLVVIPAFVKPANISIRGLDWIDVFASIACIGVGVMFQYGVSLSYPQYYNWFHGLWHLSIQFAPALIFDIFSRNKILFCIDPPQCYKINGNVVDGDLD